MAILVQDERKRGRGGGLCGSVEPKLGHPRRGWDGLGLCVGLKTWKEESPAGGVPSVSGGAYERHVNCMHAHFKTPKMEALLPVKNTIRSGIEGLEEAAGVGGRGAKEAGRQDWGERGWGWVRGGFDAYCTGLDTQVANENFCWKEQDLEQRGTRPRGGSLVYRKRA